MSVHLALRAERGCVLFRTHMEARALWVRVAAAFPRLVAMCLMPDHLHVVVPEADVDRRVPALLSGFARWRNHTRGELGSVFAPHGAPEPIRDTDHLRRTVRYVHLNPARKGLVGDPLVWPWSTHRDAVGLAHPPVVERRVDVARFHAYVSADPTVEVGGTELPGLLYRDFTLEDVASAVAGVCRRHRAEIADDRRVQRLAAQAAWFHGFRNLDVVADTFGCGRTSAWRWVRGLEPGMLRIADPVLRACVHVVGDPRITALPPGDLRPGWAPYRRYR